MSRQEIHDTRLAHFRLSGFRLSGECQRMKKGCRPHEVPACVYYRFEPPAPVGRKAVHRVATLIIASAVAITPAQAQTTYELSISGTVEKLGGNLVALSLSQGISVVVRLDSEPRVNSVAKGSGSDLKAGLR
jgi:hypothetical protein